jgi:hypothetical protein
MSAAHKRLRARVVRGIESAADGKQPERELRTHLAAEAAIEDDLGRLQWQLVVRRHDWSSRARLSITTDRALLAGGTVGTPRPRPRRSWTEVLTSLGEKAVAHSH